MNRQKRKDAVNAQRLILRLERGAIAKKSDVRGAIEHARILVDAGGLDDDEDSLLTRHRTDLQDRLERLERAYKASISPVTGDDLFDVEYTPPDIASLRPSTAVLPRTADNASPDHLQRMADSPLDAHHDPHSSVPARHNNHSSLAASPSIASPGVAGPAAVDLIPDISDANNHDTHPSIARQDSHSTPLDTTSISTLLSHHRSEQDALTDELLQMSSRLKENSLAFSSLLSEDRTALENAEKKLETNYGGMVKQRERLKGYTKQARTSTWFVIVAVAGVATAWFLLFALMRIA